MRAAFWSILIALLLFTRIPAASHYLSIDNVNLAFALEKFDPRLHQPQPPGYPLFVFFADMVNVYLANAGRTFLFVSILATGLCLPVIVGLGKRFMSIQVGQSAALLLLFSPPFWQAGLFGPLRPYLALFSLLTAYAAWRAWTGEKAYVVWGAIALGIGGGFRPDLLVYLFPLWAVSAVAGRHSVSVILRGVAVLGGIVLLWAGAMAYKVGGVGTLYQIFRDYALGQSAHGSVLLGVATQSWQRQIGRLIIWNGMAAVAWLWAVPFAGLFGKDGLGRRRIAFLIAWVIPGMLFQALVHVEEPGHTAFSIPGVCLAGAAVIWLAAGRLSAKDPARIAEVSVVGAVVLNVLLFLNYLPLPATAGAPGILNRARDALAYGTYESSLGNLRWLDDVSRVSLTEIEAVTPRDRPSIVIADDVSHDTWYMNWRIARYYVPNREIWVLTEQAAPHVARRVRRENQNLETRTGELVEIPVPAGGRIIWLLEPKGAVDRALGTRAYRDGLRQLAYTEVPADGTPFQVLQFVFAPTPVR